MAITQEEKDSIVSAVLASIRTNSKTIDQLTPVTTLSDTNYFEIDGGKKVSYEVLGNLLSALFLSDESLLELINSGKLQSASITADSSTATLTISSNGKTISTSVPIATTSAAGLMTASDKAVVESKGQPGGLAPLGGDGLVPAEFLPEMSGDVREFAGFAAGVSVPPQGSGKASTDAGCSVVFDTQRNTFLLHVAPSSGGAVSVGSYYLSWADRALFVDSAGIPHAGKAYVDTSENRLYRWGGSAMEAMGSAVALGHSADDAFPGDEGADLALEVRGGERFFYKDVAVSATVSYKAVASSKLPRGVKLWLRADTECRVSYRKVASGQWANGAWGTDVAFTLPEEQIDNFRLEVRQGALSLAYSIYQKVEGTDERIEKAVGPVDARVEALEATAAPERELYIGKVVQGYLSDSTSSSVQSLQIVASDKHVSMEGLLVLPWRGLTVKVKMPAHLQCFLCGLDTNPSFGSSIERWAKVVGVNNQRITTNGVKAQWPKKAVFYRAYFKRTDGADLAAEEVQEMIDSGEIAFTYGCAGEDICGLNAHKDSAVLAAHTGTSSVMDSFTFIHLSDIHGDALRLERAFEYARAHGIPYILCTGDYCVDTLADGIDYVHRIASAYPDVRFIPSVGNHDMAQTRTPLAAVTESEAFAKVLGPFADDGTITAEHTYYYTDVATMATPTNPSAPAKVRIICLNEYEGADWSKKHISEAQLEFFINALKTVPSGYGVIVMMHGMEFGASASAEPLTKCETAENFCQQYRRNSIAGIAGHPFSRIAEAWQGKTAVSFTFTNPDDGTEIEVSDDFSAASSGELICFLSGHEHYDLVGYNPTESKLQVTLNVCCASGISDVSGGSDTLSASGDLPRARGVTQDAFNVCGVSRSRGEIRLVRIGADITGVGMTRRDVAVIKYK